jgi:hypothetical protein
MFKTLSFSVPLRFDYLCRKALPIYGSLTNGMDRYISFDQSERAI